jgi:nitrate/nitrite transport system permease protein
MNQAELERIASPLAGVPALGGAVLRRLRAIGVNLGFTVGGLLLLLAIWWILARLAGKDLPGPSPALAQLWTLLSNPFYNHGPNDQGIGLQMGSSLQRVFAGFGLGCAVAIPVGVFMGANSTVHRLTDPIVQVLRPVSPLAWFPIGLAAFRSAGEATIFVIFITSLWPTMINTAFGVGSVPADYKNVSRVFRFSTWKYFTRVLLPHSLGHIVTGLRLSMGVAWMVIVAAEMLSGSSGIGFFVWNSWNALSLPNVMSAILLIGGTGLLLDRAFYMLQRRLSYAE